MKTRIELLESLAKGLVIAELGVFKGDFSRMIYDICQPRELYLCDLFSGYVQSGDVDGSNVEFHQGYQLKNMVKEKFSHDLHVAISQKDSVEFLKSFPDQYFDFIYIDSSHQYEHTKNELNEALRVVKNGGIIAGHDYNEMHFKGVFDAVNEFITENNLPLETTTQDKLASFFIQK